MPILYVCLFNPNVLIVDAQGTQQKADFKSRVLKQRDNIQLYGRKLIALPDELNLSYRDQREYTIACIYTGAEVKEAEAQKFLEKAEGLVLNSINEDIE